MNLKDINDQLHSIKAAALSGDYDRAHSEEDSLYVAVLEQIAAGERHAVLFAKKALESQEIDFERHTA